VDSITNCKEVIKLIGCTTAFRHRINDIKIIRIQESKAVDRDRRGNWWVCEGGIKTRSHYSHLLMGQWLSSFTSIHRLNNN
jgi:hypothetical protein